jgi:hypothetical protein
MYHLESRFCATTGVSAIQPVKVNDWSIILAPIRSLPALEYMTARFPARGRAIFSAFRCPLGNGQAPSLRFLFGRKTIGEKVGHVFAARASEGCEELFQEKQLSFRCVSVPELLRGIPQLPKQEGLGLRYEHGDEGF